MQKYFKFANLLDSINVVLKYIMIICLNIIATMTIFKLSSGIYLTEMVKETTTLTVMDIIFQQGGFIVIGCLYFVSGFYVPLVCIFIISACFCNQSFLWHLFLEIRQPH